MPRKQDSDASTEPVASSVADQIAHHEAEVARLKAENADHRAPAAVLEYPKLVYHDQHPPRKVVDAADEANALAEGYALSHIDKRASEDHQPKEK